MKDMNKMTYGTAVCDLKISDKCRYNTKQYCSYDKDVINYGIKKYFINSEKISRSLTGISVKMRVDKKVKRGFFRYRIPAMNMGFQEFPLAGVEVNGVVDARGVTIQNIYFYRDFFGLLEEEDDVA